MSRRTRGDWPLAARYLDDAWEFVGDGDDRGERPSCSRGGPGSPLCAATRTPLAGSSPRESQRADAMHWPHLAAMNRWTLGSWSSRWASRRGRGRRSRTSRERRPGAASRSLMPLADAVETLAALGRLEAVDELVATLEDEARHGHRWAGPAALRSRALLPARAGRRGEAAALARSRPRTPSRRPASRSTAVAHCSSPARRSAARASAGTPPSKLEAATAIFARPRSGLWAQRSREGAAAGEASAPARSRADER